MGKIINFSADLRARNSAYCDGSLLEQGDWSLKEFESSLDDNIRVMLMQIGYQTKSNPPKLKLLTQQCADISCDEKMVKK